MTGPSITVTPHLTPAVGITIYHPAWANGIFFDVDDAARLTAQLLDAVKLLRYHLGRQAGGRATKGVSTPRKRRASRANGRKGGRPRT